MFDFDDFDDFSDDGFDHDISADLPDGFQGGTEDAPGDTCEGWCFGDDLADFAIVGGIIGYLEEEIEERKKLEREMEKDQEYADKCRDGYDPFNPSDDEPYP